LTNENHKQNNDSDDVYVYVKPLKDDRLIERLTRLRNSESQSHRAGNPYSVNTYSTPIRTLTPNLVRVIRKKLTPIEITFPPILGVNPKIEPTIANTPKSTIEIMPTYQRQRLGQQEYFKQQNRNSRIIEYSPESIPNQGVVNNQRDVYKLETDSDVNKQREANRETFVANSNQREVNPYKESEKPENNPKYKQTESLRPKSVLNPKQIPDLIAIPYHREVITYEIVPKSSQNNNNNNNQRNANKPELIQNQRPINRQESQPNNRQILRSNQSQRENIRTEYSPDSNSPKELIAEKPLTVRNKPENEKPKVSSYRPEVIPPYELEVPNRQQETPVIIPFDLKDVSRDAVVLDYSEINNRDKSYLDFLGFANSPKINPNSIRIIEMPLTTQKPLRKEWNSNANNNDLREQVVKNDTIPRNLKFKPEDAINLVVQTQNPITHRDGGYGRTPQAYKPTFRPDVRPSPGYTGDPRLRPSRPTTTERPPTTPITVRPQALPLIRQQPPLPPPPIRQSPPQPSLQILNRVEDITTRPQPVTLPPQQISRNQRLRTYKPLLTLEEDFDRKPLGRSVQNGNQIPNDSLHKVQNNILGINDLRRNFSEIKPYTNARNYKSNHSSIPLSSRNEITIPYTTAKPIHLNSYHKITRKNFNQLSENQKPTSTYTTTTTTTTTTLAPTTTVVPDYDYYYEDITEEKNSVTLPSVRKTTTTETNPKFNYRFKTTTPKPYIEYDYDYDYNAANFSLAQTTTTTTSTTTTQRPAVTRFEIIISLFISKKVYKFLKCL
jgi:hypothetical protein